MQLPWMWPANWGQLNDILHSGMAVEIKSSLSVDESCVAVVD